MKLNDRQLGRPQILYRGTKAHIQSLPNPEEGMIAYATDTNELGSFDGNYWSWGSSGGSSTFIDLTDTPSSYTGHSYKLLRVNQNETGIEFITPTSGEVPSFISLTDTPSSYTGQAGKVPVVNQSETGLEFSTISGGGGGSIGIWEPMASPTSPHSLNDEFNDESVSSNWAEFDPNNKMTVSEDKAGLVLTISNDSAEEVIGVYKAMPSVSQFSVWTKPLPYTEHDKGMKCGIFFAQHNPITTSSDIFIVANSTNNIYRWLQIEQMFQYNNYDYGLLNHEMSALFLPSYMRVRVQKNSTNAYIWLDDSLDGIFWTNISYKFNGGSVDYFTCPFVPQAFGLFIKKTSWDNMTMKARFPFFRVYENIDFFYIPEGRRV